VASADTVGSAILANTTTENSQTTPVAATLADGRFIIAWADGSEMPPGGPGWAIRARIFQADGSPSTAEFLVNTLPVPWGGYPSIAVLSDGRFVITWQDLTDWYFGSRPGALKARIFHPDATEATPELLVGGAFAGDHEQVQVAALADGRFVVTWSEQTVPDVRTTYNVKARIFGPDGVPAAPEFTAHGALEGAQFEASVAALPDGGFLVWWDADANAGVQRFLADGSPVGAELHVMQAEGEDHFIAGPTVQPLPDGRLALAWRVSSGSWLQIVDLDGTPAGPATYLAESTASPPELALAGGGLVASWNTFTEGTGQRVTAQLLKQDGSKKGESFLVDPDGPYDQWGASITALDEKRFVITWGGDDSGTPGGPRSASAQGIRAQLFAADALAPAAPLISTAAVDLDRVLLTGQAEAGSLVQVFDEHQVSVGSGQADASGAFLITTTVFPDGPHALTATATDPNENTSTASEAVAVTIRATFYSDASTLLAPQFRHLVLLGTADINGTGNALDNCLVSNDGANVLAGATGNDIYVIHQVADRVVESPTEGIDVVQAGVSFVLPENVESVMLTGSLDLGATGNGLDNVLVGNPGANILSGGAGNDLYLVQQGEDRVVERADEGVDVVNASASFTLPDHVESLVLEGSAFFGIGNALANVLVGNQLGNTLIGGGGVDVLNGGDGNDVYGVDDALDTVYEGAAAGTDSVVASVSYVLPANVEILDLVGGAAEGHGNAADNTINGNELANLLSGGGGYDQLHGGAGDDTVSGATGIDAVWGGTGRDTFVLQGVAGQEDLIADFTPGEDMISLSGLPFAKGTAVEGVSFTAGAAIPASISGPIVLYETTTQALIYDSNGAQQDGRTLLAILVGVPDLSAADLLFA
jgi:Ca2+-binding RTX toxin-like protein